MLTPNQNRIMQSALRKQRKHLQEKLDTLRASRPPRDQILRHQRHNKIENYNADLRETVELLRKLALQE